MHFETIWNEAESVVKNYSNPNRKDILKFCRDSLNDLSDAEEKVDYHNALGELLFGLCAFCAFLDEKHNIEINSATALAKTIETKRKEFLKNE